MSLSQDEFIPSVPSVQEPHIRISGDEVDLSPSSSSSSIDDREEVKQPQERLQRPPLGSRKSSGTIIVPRDSEKVELEEEEYDPEDARTMSPRRSSEDIERMSEDARAQLIEQAKQLQASLQDIVDRVESVRSEHEKLEGGNRFLQSYIGELMQTSKITTTGVKSKGKSRAMK